MQYSDATKEFFWTGRMLLGGRFIRYMRGFAHRDFVKLSECQKGWFDPQMSDINFAVPSDACLDDYKPLDIEMGHTVEPGIITENISLYADKMNDVSHVVMFDGKKIVPNSADVYLMDQEEEPKLCQAKQEEKEMEMLMKDILDILYEFQDRGKVNISEITHDGLESLLMLVISKLSKCIQMLRQAKAKRNIAIERLTKQFNKSPDTKYKFAMNRIRTLLHELSICIEDILQGIDCLGYSVAILHGSGNSYCFNTKYCMLERYNEYHELKTMDKMGAIFDQKENIPTNLIKQRSTEWFELRNTVKVTGSRAYKAIGLESLSAQKEYFSCVIGGKKENEPGEKQKKAMAHGTENEENGVATIVGKILPLFFPGYQFYEEGAYIIKNTSGAKIMVISPDGSIRSSNGSNGKTISVEIKCPLPAYIGSTPVYNEVMKRHIVQSLLELQVLDASEHLYISWSGDSTTVFKLMPNAELVKAVVDKVSEVYYSATPRCPTKIENDVKVLGKLLDEYRLSAELIGEFPSLMRKPSSFSNEQYNSSSPYLSGTSSKTSETENSDLAIAYLINFILKTIGAVASGYSLLKPTAAEVMVYLMSDMNRYWNREICHGLPIAYLIKGYSLTILTARRLLEKILDACSEQKAHVPCVTFDGQFARLKDFDGIGNPLTLFEMQRKSWSEAKQKSKNDLLSALIDIFGQCNFYFISDISLTVDGVVEVVPTYKVIVEYKNQDYGPLSTPSYLFQKKDVGDMADDNEKNETMIGCHLGNLEEETVEALTDMLSERQAGENDDQTANLHDNGATEFQCHVDEGIQALDTDQSGQPDDFDKEQDEITNNEQKFSLTEEDYRVILNLLVDGKRKSKWEKVDIEFVENIFRSTTELNKEITAYELLEIIKYLNIRFKSASCDIPKIPLSLRKTDKINMLGEVFGLGCKLQSAQRKRRPKKIRSLQDICKSIIKGKQYPKHVLTVAYCQSVWPIYNRQFYENSTVTEEISIHSADREHSIDFKPVYKPEYSEKRKQLEVRVMDGTHIRTNIKAKLIRSGLGCIKVSAWERVAKSKKTDLSLALLAVQDDGKIMHQQSDSYVRTMFSEDVELEMVANGDTEEARFCHVFRRWHEAEDNPGISSFERCERSLELRKWLLENYRFENFPPPTMYIRGIPRVTYEGLVSSIDAHLLLYAMAKGGTYNWRSVSTLVAENFMGELAEYAQTNNGVPNGTSLKNDMAKISHLHGMRFNPNRCFQMQTSKARAYEMQTATHERQNNQLLEPTDERCISKIGTRNHIFDEMVATAKRKGKISSLHDKPKGVQPVRYHYKIDETRILPSLRIGLSEKDLKD